MATNSNVFSQGSGGSVYENEVHTCFFINFLLGLHIPAVAGRILSLRQQSGSLGYHTDDLLLKCSHQETSINILFQIKHNLVISSNGETFKEVIINAWKDFSNDKLFEKEKDKIFIIKSDLTNDEKNHLNVLLDWSRVKSSAIDFVNEVERIKAKKKYLDIFRSIIGHEFPNVINDESLYKFCRTLYFIEFDLLQDNSLTKANYFSLIDQFKIGDELTTVQVWNQLYAEISRGNSKGAFYEDPQMIGEISGLLSKSTSTAVLKAFRSLSAQNYELIELIDNQIGDFHLVRENLGKLVDESINNTQIVLITGNPGLGKSALAQTYLKSILRSYSGMVLTFQADELAEGNLRDYFIRHSIRYTMKELFSCFAAFNNNIIYIDALEKLLEANGTAFQQLLLIVKDLHNVKMVISCRQSSLALLDLKYLNQYQYSKVNVSELTDLELDLVVKNLPILKPLTENIRLKSLLRIPKYLDFAYRAVKNSGNIDKDADEDTFKKYLWEVIIENKTNEFHNGLPERRSKIFVDISVKRSKKMQPFVGLDKQDPDALEKLLKENVIVQSRNAGFFAPAHDVLEDWALIRHVDYLFNDDNNPDVFFKALGNEPAMRRAYRLWVQNSLKFSEQRKNKFVTEQALSKDSQGYWIDECLIAILQSEYCIEFFSAYKASLVANDYALLLKIIKVMRTACKENDGDSQSKYYVPVGYGWSCIIILIYEHIESFAILYWKIVYDLLKEYSNIFDFKDGLPESSREGGLIMLYLLKHYIKLGYSRNQTGDEEVKLLLRFTGGIQEELKEILNDSDVKEDDGFYKEEGLKVKLVQVALSGYPSKQITKFLPEIVIGMAKRQWMKTSSKVHYPKNEQERFMMGLTRNSDPTDINSYFGLENDWRSDYFPASAEQTPTYWLLKFHPFPAINFIIELSNWCAENYARSNFAERDDCIQIDLLLNDGSRVRQYGSDLLWGVYRGLIKVSPYVWQSVLMSLEKYLLELCRKGSHEHEILDDLIGQLLRNSNSVALTGLVSSVFQAYPEVAHTHISSIYSSRHFLSYDIVRYVRDQSYFSLNTFNEIHDKERLASSKLPHRSKFEGGLQNFIQGYCFNYGTANAALFSMWDYHRLNSDPEDAGWRKRIDEMDIRTWKITNEYNVEDKVSYIIEPSYSEDIQGYVQDLKVSQQKNEENSNQLSWLSRVKEGKLTAELSKWKDIWELYLKIEEFETFSHMPGVLAEIGIIFLWEQLGINEKRWCEEMVVELIMPLMERSYNPYGSEGMASPLDLKSAIEALPVLVVHQDSENQKELEKFVFALLTSPFQHNDSHADDLYASVGRIIWAKDEKLAIKMFNGIVKHACFFKANSAKHYRPKTKEEQEEYKNAYVSLVDEAIDVGYNLDTSKVDFQTYSINYLHKALKILPKETTCPIVYNFIKRLIDLIILHKESGTDYEREEKVVHLKLFLQQKISELILWNDNELSKSLFEYLFSSALLNLKKIEPDDYGTLLHMLKFFRETIEYIIIKADDNFHNEDEQRNVKAVNMFLSAWTVFRNYLVKNNLYIFSDLLLLDIDVTWKKTAVNWKPIEKDTIFFMTCIKIFGPVQVQSVVTLLSHVGDQYLYEDGLKWLIGHLKKTEILKDIIQYKYIEQLMSRGYDNHLAEIMDDRLLLSDYMQMLDILIKDGSSDAYWIREFMISFTTK